jgi:hypothetical protein
VAHLVQSLTTGLLDRGRQVARPLWVALQDRPHRLCLHHHDTEIVRHHVVQFPGDAQPLVRDRLAGLQITLALQSLRVLGQPPHPLPPAPYHGAQQPGAGRADDEAQQIEPGTGRSPPGQGDGHQRGRCAHRTGGADPPAAVHRDAVGHDELGRYVGSRRRIGDEQSQLNGGDDHHRCAG